MVNDAVIPMAAVGIQYYGGPVVTILASKTSRRCYGRVLLFPLETINRPRPTPFTLAANSIQSLNNVRPKFALPNTITKTKNHWNRCLTTFLVCLTETVTWSNKCLAPPPFPSFSSCITFVVASSVEYNTKFFCYRAVLRLTRSRMVSFYNVMPRDWLKISAPFSQPIRSKTTIVLPHYKLLLFLVFGANSGNWLSDPTGLFYDPGCSDIGFTTHTDLMNNLYFVIFLITRSRCK